MLASCHCWMCNTECECDVTNTQITGVHQQKTSLHNLFVQTYFQEILLAELEADVGGRSLFLAGGNY